MDITLLQARNLELIFYYNFRLFLLTLTSSLNILDYPAINIFYNLKE